MNDSGIENKGEKGEKGKKGEIKEREEATPSSVASVSDENKEAVADTLRELKSEREGAAVKKKRRAADVALRVFSIIFFPVSLVVMLVRKIFKRFKVGIAAKATVIFALVFGVMIVAYVAFILASIGTLVSHGEPITQSYMNRLIITSAVLVIVFIALGCVIGYLSSQYLINPVRKITDRVREISEENMSARLDPLETQDELMELTAQINEMLASLQEAFERQENFVSDASHELKTPLAVIAGYSNLLRRWGKDDPKILNESVEAISRESENMKRIVDQLLWLAKIGNFKPNNTVFNLYETVEDIVDGYKMTNTKHEITLSGDPSITLDTDKNLITEAVRTLVDNAIKYTPPETGIIRINIIGKDDSVELSIADNGIGIDEKDIGHIFERFYRCDKVRGREKGSSGLGLTICKSIVEMLGGNISVESKIGEGSAFKIVLY